MGASRTGSYQVTPPGRARARRHRLPSRPILARTAKRVSRRRVTPEQPVPPAPLSHCRRDAARAPARRSKNPRARQRRGTNRVRTSSPGDGQHRLASPDDSAGQQGVAPPVAGQGRTSGGTSPSGSSTGTRSPDHGSCPSRMPPVRTRYQPGSGLGSVEAVHQGPSAAATSAHMRSSASGHSWAPCRHDQRRAGRCSTFLSGVVDAVRARKVSVGSPGTRRQMATAQCSAFHS
jgi:hypothetical protein